MRIALLAALLGISLSACATSFTGSARVEGGARGCEAKCRGEGMTVAGMVFMGEYTNGCVCAAPGKAASTDARTLLMASAEGAGGSSAGVMMQMQRQQQQQQQH